MSQKAKKKPLFKVAKEFNVATRTIVNSLESEGYEAEDKPNFKVTPEMYAALDKLYGEDKAKSAEHIRAREEYEERRTTMRSSRNKSVSVDTFVDPIEDLEPLEDEKQEDLSLDPIDDKPEEEDEKTGDKQQEEAADSETADEAEPEKEELAAEPEQHTESASAEKDEIEPPIPAEEEEEEEQEEEPEPAVKQDDKSRKQKDSKDKEPDTDQTKVDAEIKEQDQPDETADKQESKEEKQAEEIIRGRAKKLSGTRVLGKINVSKTEDKQESESKSDKSKSSKKKKQESKKKKPEKPEEEKPKKDTKDTQEEDKKDKKKKRKPKRVKDEDKEKEKKEKPDEAESAKSKKKKKRMKSRKPKAQVDESDVETKMKETMQMLQTSSTGGKKRQKRRRQKRDEMAAEREKQAELEQQDENVLEVTEFMTVSDLAELLDVNPTEIITHCMNLGMVVSINQRLDANTLELLADEYGREVRFVDAEEINDDIELEEDEPEDLKPRAPVVTVMGHVDHGKTSLLDYIRKTHVTEGEEGGITQHIGAYEVVTDDNRKITFLDTPGHEAFTAMRARGAQVTDLVILVVAADDEVMPQTVEAINHAQAAGVSIVVAINKIDKEGSNPDRIRQQLADHNVIVEDWGGKTQIAMVSAKHGDGIPELLEKVLIESELMELKANPDRKANGIVLESRIDRGKGVVANILIQNGTLKIGDSFVAGQHYGRVRALENEKGERLKSIGPSTPAQLTGFHGLPQAGDKIVITADEKSAKEIAIQRQQIRREQDLRKVKHLTLDDISRKMALGEIAELNLIIKGDVDGSIEALSGSLQKLSTDEVKVNIIHTGVGAITESDVLLASASNAIIIGFQVRPSSTARDIAQREEIDIRLFGVIYEAVDAVRDALEGMLSPELKEKVTATVEVRETFKVPKVGTVAGCFVTDGKISRNNHIRLVRDGIVIHEGELDSLKRFKDDVKEVASGYECGINIKSYNDIKVGDVIEAYEIIETKRTLADESS